MNSSLEDVAQPAAIYVERLSKTYMPNKSTHKALDGVTFCVEQGEFFGLLGPNGAGKSTLIGALAGIIRPDSGSISVLGRKFEEDRTFCKMAVGIVPQEITFDPFFTVRETLQLQSGFYGLRHNDKWIDELTERLFLSDKRDTSVSRLSGGMKRRVLIAQALVHKPPVIVLDEPTAGVDVTLRHNLWELMNEFHSCGHTIILTTHYLEEAQSLCSRIALLNDGKVVALDSTDALLARFSEPRLQFELIDGVLPESNSMHFEKVGPTTWTVNYTDAATLRAILNAIDAAHCTIGAMTFGTANLEDVFMQLTNHD